MPPCQGGDTGSTPVTCSIDILYRMCLNCTCFKNTYMSLDRLRSTLLQHPKVATLGIPSSLGAPTGVLTGDAPRVFREGLEEMAQFLGVEINDLGDIPCPSRRESNIGGPDELKFVDAIATVACATAVQVRDAILRGEFPICVGGDHSITFGTVPGALAALRSIHGTEAELGIICSDAHLDMHTHKTSNSKNAHGTSMAGVMGYGDPRLVGILRNEVPMAVKPSNVIHLGSREIDEAEIRFAKEHGVQVFTMQDLREGGLGPVYEAIKDLRKRVQGVWWDMDIDGLDPSVGPATGMASPYGISNVQILDLARHFKTTEGAPLVGMEIAEFVPRRDIANITRDLILETAALLLGGDYSHYAKVGSCAPEQGELAAADRPLRRKIIEAEKRLETLIRELEMDMEVISPRFEERKLCGACVGEIAGLIRQMLTHRGDLREWVHAQDSMRDTAAYFHSDLIYDYLPPDLQPNYQDALNQPFTASTHPSPIAANYLRLLVLKIAALEAIMDRPDFWRKVPEFQKRRKAGGIGKLVFRVSDAALSLLGKLPRDFPQHPSIRE